MNQEQVLGVLRIILPVILGYVAGKGWISDSAIPDVVTAILTIVVSAWSIVSHTQAAQAANVASMPGTIPSSDGKSIAIVDPKLVEAVKENATDLTGSK